MSVLSARLARPTSKRMVPVAVGFWPFISGGPIDTRGRQ